MSTDKWSIINERMTAFSLLHKRMDRTQGLLYMKEEKLRNFEDNADLDRVINVTGNRLATYGHRIIENLGAYKWQKVVSGDISKREAHKVEEFLNASLDQTNMYLTDNFEDVPDLQTFWAKHICNRGRIGVQWMAWVEDGEYKIQCVPLDMRWTPYVKGKWIAPITFRKKVDLEQELEKLAKKAEARVGEYHKVTLRDDNEVRDYWDNDVNELWINKKLVFSQENNYGRWPFVTVVAPSGFMFRGKGYIEHEGEDIYFLIRNLEKELNRSLSIEQTLGMESLLPPLMQTKPPGENADERPLTGDVVPIKEGEEFKEVPRGDMNRAGFAGRADILRQMEEGGPMQPRAYTQPPSAVEVATEVELLNQLINSRVIALEMGLSQLYYLMTDMAATIRKSYSGELSIGGRGNRKSFSFSKLKDTNTYSIAVKLMGKNTRLEIVNWARAESMWGRAPRKYIFEDVLMVEDPDGWERAMDLEKAKEVNPAIGLLDMAIRYAEEAEDIEDEIESDLKKQQSKILTHDYIIAMRQRMNPVPEEGVTPQAPKPDKGNANALISLTGQAAGGVAQPKLPRGVVR